MRLNYYNCKFGQVNEAIVVFDRSKKVYVDIRQNDIAEEWWDSWCDGNRGIDHSSNYIRHTVEDQRAIVVSYETFSLY